MENKYFSCNTDGVLGLLSLPDEVRNKNRFFMKLKFIFYRF